MNDGQERSLSKQPMIKPRTKRNSTLFPMPVGMNRYWQTEGSMNDKINVKTEGNKILFYREGEDDWFLGCKIETQDDVQSVIKRQGFNPWFTTQLQNDFYDICKNLISES